MSCILAIDLSTPCGHVALLDGDGVRFEQTFTSHRSHNSMLYAPLGAALDAAGSALQSIVVGTGPGSYTGVRISIAAANGVALSRNVPVSGLPSIAALSDAEEHLAVGDARRGKFYAAHICDGRVIGEIDLLDESALRIWLEAHAALPRFTSDATPPLGDVSIQPVKPNAVLLARNAAAQHPEPQLLIEPLYMQDAFITQAKPRTMGLQITSKQEH
jgi:tRNA threonylcarbamoyl adenosine modification protein YeaZ